MKIQIPDGAVIQSVTTVSFGDAVYSPKPTTVEVIRKLCDRGDLILAIKMVRSDMGYGLLEAKKIVEAIRDVDGRDDPWKRGF